VAVPDPRADEDDLRLLTEAAQGEVALGTELGSTGTERLKGPDALSLDDEKEGRADPDAVTKDAGRKRLSGSDRGPKHRPGGLSRFLGAVMQLIGLFCLIAGLGASTSVSTRDAEFHEVHNIGLISHKQLLVLGGIGIMGVGTLLRIQSALEVTADLHRKQSE
jgi:hypothetical protein